MENLFIKINYIKILLFFACVAQVTPSSSMWFKKPAAAAHHARPQSAWARAAKVGAAAAGAMATFVSIGYLVKNPGVRHAFGQMKDSFFGSVRRLLRREVAVPLDVDEMRAREEFMHQHPGVPLPWAPEQRAPLALNPAPAPAQDEEARIVAAHVQVADDEELARRLAAQQQIDDDNAAHELFIQLNPGEELPWDPGHFAPAPLAPPAVPVAPIPVVVHAVAEWCGICEDDVVAPENMRTLTCGHRFCAECLNLLLDNTVFAGELVRYKCPQRGCEKDLGHDDAARIVQGLPNADERLARYDEVMARAREQAFVYPVEGTKPCPKCHTPIMKNGGCLYVRCGACGCGFCYRCYGSHHVYEAGQAHGMECFNPEVVFDLAHTIAEQLPPTIWFGDKFVTANDHENVQLILDGVNEQWGGDRPFVVVGVAPWFGEFWLHKRIGFDHVRARAAGRYVPESTVHVYQIIKPAEIDIARGGRITFAQLVRARVVRDEEAERVVMQEIADAEARAIPAVPGVPDAHPAQAAPAAPAARVAPGIPGVGVAPAHDPGLAGHAVPDAQEHAPAAFGGFWARWDYLPAMRQVGDQIVAMLHDGRRAIQVRDHMFEAFRGPDGTVRGLYIHNDGREILLGPIGPIVNDAHLRAEMRAIAWQADDVAALGVLERLLAR